MSPIPNPRFIFKEIPKDLPIPGVTTEYDESQLIDLDSVNLKGGFLLKLLAASIDPYMRNRMRPESLPGEVPAYPLGSVIDGFCIGTVLKSQSNFASIGDHVYGFMRKRKLRQKILRSPISAYQMYNVISNTGSDTEGLESLRLTKVKNKYNLPWRYFVGVLGMTGQTAYYGLKDISSPREGETLYVSAAAGAVGSTVVQLSKRLGLRVIGSAGSEEKIQYIKSLGADHAFNYKTSNVKEELKKHGPIDIYFDNVGGKNLEDAIENAAQKARFVICGAISAYNHQTNDAYGVKNLWLLNRYRIKMEVFVMLDWHTKYEEEFYEIMPQLVASGDVKCLEHIYRGLEEAGQAMQDVLTGRNKGKAVVVMSDN